VKVHATRKGFQCPLLFISQALGLLWALQELRSL
jgi:hypothetical protein